ncbi:hypothetical protein B0H15DRAFT_607787 [Mycena belliarum]|uniref:Uncharacterized protein n=1 Tax=Mycena belliarum TaxID=1033014 RepID=A0AAD6XHZ8_9AGAR|nr:hypothetical protein B0H15DRAFT_607787 [Mycena belliae]
MPNPNVAKYEPRFGYGTPSSMNPLPGFQFVDKNTSYAELHRLLWRAPTPSPVTHEPSALAEYIDIWTGEDAMQVDSETDPEPTSRPASRKLRFIDLNKHPELCIASLDLLSEGPMVVREEYVDFMTHILQQRHSRKRRFFLTGQPGIGKSVGARFFLFWLLASGQSVFLVPETDAVYYFSETGVQRTSGHGTHTDNLDVKAAVQRSWVLIDVDLGTDPGAAEWYPPRSWLSPCATLVWTSSPRHERLRRFRSQWSASVWYMRPWLREEIMLAINVGKLDSAEVWARYCLSGPVARSLFSESDRADTNELDRVICQSFTKGLFSFATSPLQADEESSHRMYLVRPSESFDQNEVLFDRRQPTYGFLSTYITTRTVELIAQHAHNFHEWLASAFNQPATRGAAGKLVESLFHRMVVAGSADPFKLGGRPSELVLIGEASDFILEARTTLPPTPLYLLPQSQTFAALDAIIVTDTVLWLVQSTVSDRHSFNIKTILAILNRLQQQKIKVEQARLVYCLVGSDAKRVAIVGRSATEKLRALKTAKSGDRVRELGNSKTVMDRLLKFDVEGYWLETIDTLTRVWPADDSM